MTCAQAEEHLLDSIDEPLPADVQRAMDRHVASCAACATFAARLRAVDTQLVAALPPLAAPDSIAAGVHRQVRKDRAATLADSLPDVIHLAGCTAATLISAALLPIEASVTLAAGAAFTCVTYVGMAVVRWSLELAEQPDW
jgi:anti-sigma factor RsiW